MSEPQSYYEQPVIKPPVWTNEIPMYFFFGGLAGTSAGLAYLSELSGNDVLGRRTWGTALGAIMISPALLTADLGRPARFLNMLRMVKVTSPMSVGSWVLLASGATTGLAAVSVWTGLFVRLGRVAKPAAALLGLPLSTYTAALLANTSVPVWHEARRTLPLVFASGAALSAGGAGVIVAPPDQARAALRLALAGTALELAFTTLMERRLGPFGEPYRREPAVRWRTASRVCLTAGMALLAARGSRSRAAATAGGALLLGGAISTRFSVFKAGHLSASDPKYVIGPQRVRADARAQPHAPAARQDAAIDEPVPASGSPATGDQT